MSSITEDGLKNRSAAAYGREDARPRSKSAIPYVEPGLWVCGAEIQSDFLTWRRL